MKNVVFSLELWTWFRLMRDGLETFISKTLNK